MSGTAGSGKTSICAHFAAAACGRGERCLYLALEESPGQIIRNMRSIGIDLQPHVDSGLLRMHASRPTMHGLEMHLTTIHREIDRFAPQVVVIDPITNLASAGTEHEANLMLMRAIDMLKARQITGVFNSLTSGGPNEESTEVGMLSLMDTWLLLRVVESDGERNRLLYVFKSRGMAHSNQVREFLLTERGIELVDIYVGPKGVLTGSARAAEEARGRAAELAAHQEIDRRERQLAHRRRVMEARIEALRARLENEEAAHRQYIEHQQVRHRELTQQRQTISARRIAKGGDGWTDASAPGDRKGGPS